MSSAGSPAARLVALALCGVAISTLAAPCGIGGGIFGVPLLHYGFRVPLRNAVATTLCLVAATALASTVSEALHPAGALFWSLIGTLVVTSLVGAELGFAVARHIATRPLKALFCVVLAAVGLHLILSGATGEPVPPDPAEGFHPGLGEHLLVAAFGVGAGIVVPLLGVGGGLVVVPALLLGMPELGYLGARATSLAMAVAASARSLWLYQRAALVDWRAGAAFGLGGLIGATAGVYLVHLEGATAIGQLLLGGVLCIAATRFGADTLATRGS